MLAHSLGMEERSMKGNLISSIVVILVFVQPLDAAVYKWVDEKGKIHYSDERPQGQGAIEQEVELKNSQLRFMDERDKRALEGYDQRRDKKLIEEQQAKELQQHSIKADIESDTVSNEQAQYQCFEASVVSPGISEAVYPARKLTEDEIEVLATLFKGLAGRWRGKNESYSCHGNESSPRKRHENYWVEANIQQKFSRELVFEAELRSTEPGTSKRVNFEFELRDQWLRISGTSNLDQIEISKLDANHLSFSRVYWRHTKRGGTVMLEERLLISLDKEKLVIEMIKYNQGSLSEVSTWKLEI